MSVPKWLWTPSSSPYSYYLYCVIANRGPIVLSEKHFDYRTKALKGVDARVDVGPYGRSWVLARTDDGRDIVVIRPAEALRDYELWLVDNTRPLEAERIGGIDRWFWYWRMDIGADGRSGWLLYTDDESRSGCYRPATGEDIEGKRFRLFTWGPAPPESHRALSALVGARPVVERHEVLETVLADGRYLVYSGDRQYMTLRGADGKARATIDSGAVPRWEPDSRVHGMRTSEVGGTVYLRPFVNYDLPAGAPEQDRYLPLMRLDIEGKRWQIVPDRDLIGRSFDGRIGLFWSRSDQEITWIRYD